MGSVSAATLVQSLGFMHRQKRRVISVDGFFLKPLEANTCQHVILGKERMGQKTVSRPARWLHKSEHSTDTCDVWPRVGHKYKVSNINGTSIYTQVSS